MNQVPAENKLLENLLKRLQELDKENKILKTLLKNKQNHSQTQTKTHTHPYFKVKELVIENQEEEQVCSLCNYGLNSEQAINLIKLYFCDNNCSLLMEKLIDTIITTFRKK